MMIRYKRPIIQLTSLIDLLFVMIFIALVQQKAPPGTTIERNTKPAPAVTEEPKTEEQATNETQSKPSVPPSKIVGVSATFSFYPPSSNPKLASGSFQMRGEFNHQTGVLELGGTQWIEQPKGYEMVPLKGKINEARDQFTGSIQFYGCKLFTLNRASPKTGDYGIEGSWKGSYTCLQGETGLTLTID